MGCVAHFQILSRIFAAFRLQGVRRGELSRGSFNPVGSGGLKVVRCYPIVLHPDCQSVLASCFNPDVCDFPAVFAQRALFCEPRKHLILNSNFPKIRSLLHKRPNHRPVNPEPFALLPPPLHNQKHKTTESPEPLNPEPPNPEPLNPKPSNPKP